MLVLKRKPGQAIDVGDNVRIILEEINGSEVKVVIAAPRDVRVRRTEIAEHIKAENLKAAKASQDRRRRLPEMPRIEGGAGGSQDDGL
jgi:carbon storage regulator